MYAQVVRVQLQPGRADEAQAIFQDSVVPAVKQQKGFKNAYFLLDIAANRGIGFSLWKSKEDVDALASNGFYQEQILKFAQVFAGPPEREVYLVAAEA